MGADSARLLQKAGVMMDELLMRGMPHSAEAEQAVLGSMLIDGAHTAGLVMQGVQAEDFTGPNRAVFDACRKLFQTGKPIDAVTVGNLLGPEYQKLLLQLLGL